jgi:hypothetical protein
MIEAVETSSLHRPVFVTFWVRAQRNSAYTRQTVVTPSERPGAVLFEASAIVVGVTEDDRRFVLKDRYGPAQRWLASDEVMP